MLLLTCACPNIQRSPRCMLGLQPIWRPTSVPFAFHDRPVGAPLLAHRLARLAARMASSSSCFLVVPLGTQFFLGLFGSRFSILFWPSFKQSMRIFEGPFVHYLFNIPPTSYHIRYYLLYIANDRLAAGITSVVATSCSWFGCVSLYCNVAFWEFAICPIRVHGSEVFVRFSVDLVACLMAGPAKERGGFRHHSVDGSWSWRVWQDCVDVLRHLVFGWSFLAVHHMAGLFRQHGGFASPPSRLFVSWLVWLGAWRL